MERLKRAERRMEEFLRQADRAAYASGDLDALMAEALAAMEAGEAELRDAEQLLESQLALGEQQRRARELERAAMELAEATTRLDESVSPGERAQMRVKLEDAMRLLEQGRAMDPRQGGPMPRSGGGSGTGHGPAGPSNGGPPPNAPALDKVNVPFLGEDDGESTEILVQELMSKAIEARKKSGIRVDRPASSAEFHQLEKEFYEDAAWAGPGKPDDVATPFAEDRRP
jgi:hypothetical protein